MLREIFVSLVMLFTAVPQTTPVVDFTGIVPRNRVREPVSASASGGAVGGDAHVAQQESSVAITIVSLELAREAPAPSVIFEIRLENVSSQTLALPLDPNLADFEPETT